jgi:hypothetical protein
MRKEGTMAILERWIQKIENGERDAYMDKEKKYQALEGRLGGFPSKRHYAAIACAEDFGTIIWEREWESFTAMEAAYAKFRGDSEFRELADAPSVIVSERIEYYWVVS